MLSTTATHLEVLVANSATVGEPTDVRVIALDAANHRVSNFTGTIELSSTDSATAEGSTALPLTYTFTTSDHGEHDFSLTPGATGSETITATDTPDSLTAGTAALTVNAAPVATHFLVLSLGSSASGGEGCGGQSTFAAGLGLGGSSAVYAGIATSVEVIALDASNHVVPNYTGTITLSSTDTGTKSGTAALPITYTFTTSDHGVHVFSLTPAAAGTETITATDTSSSSITGSVSLTVATAPTATHIEIEIPRDIQAGQATPVKVLVLDASNHLVPDYTGTVQLTSSDTAATVGGTVLPASYTFTAADDGQHTFLVTFATTGSATITATDSANNFTDTVTTTIGSAGGGSTTFGFGGHNVRHHGHF